MLQANGNVLPENKVVSSKLNSIADLKKYMKRAMPFVQAIREKFEIIKLKAFDLTSEFDEYELLTQHKDYILNTLDVSIY